MDKSPSHGGRRQGAGRKPGPEGKRENVAFTMPAEIRQFLDDLTSIPDAPITRSQLVEKLIRSSKEFADWQSRK